MPKFALIENGCVKRIVETEFPQTYRGGLRNIPQDDAENWVGRLAVEIPGDVPNLMRAPKAPSAPIVPPSGNAIFTENKTVKLPRLHDVPTPKRVGRSKISK